MNAKDAFGAALATIRKQKKVSQEQLAFDSGLSRGFISRMEHGVHGPNIETIITIARALGVPAWELIHLTETILDQQKSVKRLKR